MRSTILALALSSLAGPSLALSCMAPDVAVSFNEAAASEKVYMVVHGTLTFDETKLPEVDINHQDQIPPHVDIEARLSGMSLSKAGFETAFDRPVTLRALCYGPWCGRAVSGAAYLSFLEKPETGFVLAVTPCGGFEFSDPSEEMLNKVTQCYRDGSCK